jgi:hypothetical protein
MPSFLPDFGARLGSLFGYANDVQTKTLNLYSTDIDTVLALYEGTAFRQDTANLGPLQNLSTGLSTTIGVSIYAAIQQSITATIINDMRDLYGAYDGTLTTALRKLRDQMISESYKFEAVGTSSVTYTATSGNQGTGTVLVRAYRPASSSLYLQEMYNETIRLNCTVGGDIGNFGEATFAFSGFASYAPNNIAWPGGSGLSTTVQATSAAITASVGAPGVSILANGDFESWSSNTPRAWTIVTGTAGTQVTQGSTPCRGTYALQFVGNGSTLTRIRQQIASGSGAPTSVQAETDYAITFCARVAAATTGVVGVALRDASGTVVGTAITLNLASLTTTYTTQSVTFSIAKSALPTTLYLDIYSTTAIANTGTLMIDELVLAPMTRLYAAGPSVLITCGQTDWAAGDSGTIGVVSDPSTNGAFMKGFARWVGAERQGIYLPLAGTNTLADSLVTV